MTANPAAAAAREAPHRYVPLICGDCNGPHFEDTLTEGDKHRLFQPHNPDLCGYVHIPRDMPADDAE